MAEDLSLGRDEQVLMEIERNRSFRLMALTAGALFAGALTWLGHGALLVRFYPSLFPRPWPLVIIPFLAGVFTLFLWFVERPPRYFLTNAHVVRVHRGREEHFPLAMIDRVQTHQDFWHNVELYVEPGHLVPAMRLENVRNAEAVRSMITEQVDRLDPREGVLGRRERDPLPPPDRTGALGHLHATSETAAAQVGRLRLQRAPAYTARHQARATLALKRALRDDPALLTFTWLGRLPREAPSHRGVEAVPAAAE